jgi:hypothetical protein
MSISFNNPYFGALYRSGTTTQQTTVPAGLVVCDVRWLVVFSHGDCDAW